MDADLLPVLVHIQAGLDTDLGLAALARESGLSESTLKRRIRDATGESPRQHVERLRLERAASQLLLREATVLDIALDNGFGSHETFTRAFGRHFGMTPSAWRERSSAGDLGVHDRQPGLTETTDGVSLSSTRIVEMRPVDVAFLRHIGPYDQVDGGTWTRIRVRLRELGYPGDGLPLGIALDNPFITAPDRLRFDCGWTIAHDLPPECGLGRQTIPGGTFAVTTYVGPFALIGRAYATISERLMRHARDFEFGIGDFGATVEWYRTGSIDEEHYLNQVDITFPVTARARGPWRWSEPRILDSEPAPARQEDTMSDFEFRDVPEQHVAAVRISTSQDGISEAMAQAFPRLYQTVTEAGAVPAGPPLTRYFSFGGPTIEFECAIPLQAPFAGAGDIEAGTIGGGEAAVAIHMGPYDTIHETWAALTSWLGRQGREPSGPGWEYYLTDPGEEPDPAKWVTEVYLPVSPAPVPAS